VGQIVNGSVAASSLAATESDHSPLLTVAGVSKRYGGRWVLRDASFNLSRGEFVGLVGPNGAGKSTLIKILDGVVTPDAGAIRVDGVELGGASREKIGVVHQDLGLIETLTVAENLTLGIRREHSARGPFLHLRSEIEFAETSLRDIGLSPSVARKRVSELSLGEQTLVAVARVMAGGAQLLVIDEATSSLSPAESTWLIQRLRDRCRLGAGVLMVSHKLSEITDAADRVIVVVDGVIAADVSMSDVTSDHVVNLMAPESDKSQGSAGDRATVVDAPVVLEMRAAQTRRGGPFDLTIHAGEVVGVTGLIGSGLYELALLASGRSKVESGSVSIRDDVTVGFLPPDRMREANFPANSVEWNLTICSLNKWQSPWRYVRLHREVRDAERMHSSLSVKPNRLEALQSSLSGGNQQKVLMGRLLLSTPELLVLTEPTRGVDIATRRELYRLILEQRDRGVAILVVSSDIGDLIELADRVGVVDAGSMQQLRSIHDLSEHELLRLV